MIPTGFESEQVAGIDHDGRYGEGLASGHRYERQTISYAGPGEGLFDGNYAGRFRGGLDERYDFIARTPQRFGYRLFPRADKGVMLLFLERVSGYSRQQLTRLVKRGLCFRTPLLRTIKCLGTGINSNSR